MRIFFTILYPHEYLKGSDWDATYFLYGKYIIKIIKIIFWQQDKHGECGERREVDTCEAVTCCSFALVQYGVINVDVLLTYFSNDFYPCSYKGTCSVYASWYCVTERAVKCSCCSFSVPISSLAWCILWHHMSLLWDSAVTKKKKGFDVKEESSNQHYHQPNGVKINLFSKCLCLEVIGSVDGE